MSDKKNAILFVFVSGINTLLNVIFAPYISRAFTLEENGTYGQVILVSNLLTMLFSLGVSNIYAILLAENKLEVNKVFSNSTVLLSIAGFCACLIQIVIGINSTNLLSNNIYNYLLIFTIGTFFNILSSTLTLQLIDLQKTSYLLIVTLVLNVFKIGLSVLAIQYFKSLNLFVLFLSLLAAANYLLLIGALPKQMLKFKGISTTFMKKILHESYPYLVLSFLGYSILYIDGWMLSKLLGTEEYAIYRNGAIEIPFIATIYTSLSAIMINKLAKLKVENKINEIFELKKMTSQTIAVISYPIIVFLILNADIFIPIYLSNKYFASSMVFAIFSIVSLIRINNYGDLLMLNRNRKSLILTNFIAFVLNIVLNYTLINLLGYIGAAIAYVISIFVLTSMLVAVTIKSYKVSINQYFSFRVLGSLLALSILFVGAARLFYYFGLIPFIFCSIISMMLVYLWIFRYTNWVNLEYLPARIKKILLIISSKK